MRVPRRASSADPLPPAFAHVRQHRPIRRRRASTELQLPLPCQRRVLREIALDAGGQRVDQPRLVGRVAQLALLPRGLEMNAVSTRMLGTSGAFSTAKPACSTRRLVQPADLAERRPAPRWPSCRLSLICAVVLMSSIARSTCVSLIAALTPPTRSAAFSRCAIQRAAALLAPFWLSANTLAPRASGGRRRRRGSTRTGRPARAAPCARARAAARNSRRRASASRACSARALSRSRSCSAIASTTSFSRRPLGPIAPGSSPPWPGSRATMISRST